MRPQLALFGEWTHVAVQVTKDEAVATTSMGRFDAAAVSLKTGAGLELDPSATVELLRFDAAEASWQVVSATSVSLIDGRTPLPESFLQPVEAGGASHDTEGEDADGTYSGFHLWVRVRATAQQGAQQLPWESSRRSPRSSETTAAVSTDPAEAAASDPHRPSEDHRVAEERWGTAAAHTRRLTVHLEPRRNTEGSSSSSGGMGAEGAAGSTARARVRARSLSVVVGDETAEWDGRERPVARASLKYACAPEQHSLALKFHAPFAVRLRRGSTRRAADGCGALQVGLSHRFAAFVVWTGRLTHSELYNPNSALSFGKRSGQRARKRPAGVPGSAWRSTGCHCRGSPTYLPLYHYYGDGLCVKGVYTRHAPGFPMIVY